MTGISPGQSYSSAFLPNNNHIIDTYLRTPHHYQGQSRRSCRCSSHQSDPCHHACSHPATWMYFRPWNIFRTFLCFSCSHPPKVPQAPYTGAVPGANHGVVFPWVPDWVKICIVFVFYLFVSFHALLTVQESIFSMALTIWRDIDWNSPDNTWWWQVTQDCSMSSGSVWWPGMYTLLLYLQWK